MKIVSFSAIKKPFGKRFLWICAVIAKVLDREFRELSAVSHIRKCLVDLCAQGRVVITLYQRDSIRCAGCFINDDERAAFILHVIFKGSLRVDRSVYFSVLDEVQCFTERIHAVDFRAVLLAEFHIGGADGVRCLLALQVFK